MIMMKQLSRALLFDKEAMKLLANDAKTNRLGLLLILLLGIAYGLFSVQVNADYVGSFESDLLRNLVVPFIFIFFGFLTMILTRLALTLLLWAGARGFGGPGFMKSFYRLSSIILVPSVLAMPVLIGLQAGLEISLLTWLLLIPGFIWIYILGVKAMEATQSFIGIRAYGSVLVMLIFFTCIFYLTIPPSE